MGKKTPRIPVDDYYATVFYGWCLQADRVIDLRADERTFWEGSVETTQSVFVDRRDLFGGDEMQGGVMGVVDFLMGDPTQVLPAAVARRFAYNDIPLTPENAPAYRGVTSIMFRGAGPGGSELGGVGGTDDISQPGQPSTGGFLGAIAAARNTIAGFAGFLWGSNNPIIPPVDGRFQRHASLLDPATAVISRDGEQLDHNPAHMIFDMLVNPQAGIGASEAQIDRDSFEQVAQTLFDEQFGLTFLWSREDTLESVIQDILAHINGVLFIEPDNGLFTLRLFRDDFVVEDLPVFGPEELTLTDYDRKGRGEIVNNYTVTYTNTFSLNEETVSAVDEAGIAMQLGEEIAGNSNYHMVRDRDLAYELAERQLRISAAPLAQGRAEGRRSLGILRPGGRFVLRYPEYLGEETIVCRVTEIDFGKTQRPTIQVNWTEDIFTLPQALQFTRQPTRHLPPVADPTPLDFQEAFSLPYYMAVQVPDLQLEDQDFPDTIVGLLGDQAANIDTQGFVIFSEAVDPSGLQGAESLGRVPITDRLILRDAVVQEVETVLKMDIPDSTTLVSGDLVMLGRSDDDESNTELALVLENPTIDGLDFCVRVARGVLDTTPQDHPAGDEVWTLTQSYGGYDLQPRTADAPVEYGLATITSRGFLPTEDIVPFTYTPVARPYLPSRPANVTVGGTVQFGVRAYDPDPAIVPVTWSNRNRLAEDVLIRRWTEGDIAVEPGQLTTIEVRDINGGLITTHADLPGTSFDIPIASFGSGAFHRIRVYATRDGLRSFQAHEIVVNFASRSGYGVGYGFQYGD